MSSNPEDTKKIEALYTKHGIDNSLTNRYNFWAGYLDVPTIPNPVWAEVVLLEDRFLETDRKKNEHEQLLLECYGCS